jgi:hypothetical protein
MATKLDAAAPQLYEHIEKKSLDSKPVADVVEDGHIINDPKEETFKEGRLHLEQTTSYLDNDHNLVYDHDDEEPAFHARTWFALIAMFFLNVTQVFALLGPPAVVSQGTQLTLHYTC